MEITTFTINYETPQTRYSYIKNNNYYPVMGLQTTYIN